MSQQNRKIAKNAVWNTIKTVSGIAFPLITFPYISRVLGVDVIGEYNFSMSIISYFILIAGLGISTYGIREGTTFREDKDRVQSFASELFTINMVSTVLAYLLLIITVLVVPKINSYGVIIYILSAEIFATTIGCAWICNIYEDFASLTVRTVLFQFISLVLMFIFVKSPEDLNKYVAIMSFSNFGSNAVNYFYIRKKYCKFRIVSGFDWKKHIRPILVIFSTNVAVTIYVYSDSTMLGFLMTDYDVGLYTTSVKIYVIIKNVLSALLLVLIPKFSVLFSKTDKEEISELFSKVFNTLTLLMLPVITGLFMISDDVIYLVSGEDFLGATTSLRLLSIAMFFALFAFLYVQCVLIPVKKEKVVLKATIISAVTNVLLNFIFIPLIGINGAAITTIISELITFALSCKEGVKHVRIKGVFRELLTIIAGCVLIVAVCLLSRRLNIFWMRLAVSVAGSIIAYFGFLLVVRNRTVRNIWGLLVPRLRKKES